MKGTVRGDIDAIVKSEAHIAHIFSSGSAPHSWVKFGKQPHELIPDIKDAVMYTKQCGFTEIVLSLEDAVRADPEHLVEVGRIAKDIAGDAVRYNIPDTVGTISPRAFGYMVNNVYKAIPGNVRIAAHCHNDFGLAVANTIAGFENGASEAQTTVMGLGERAGNASFEVLTGCNLC